MQVFEVSNKLAYDAFLLQNGGSVLQSFAWGEFQKRVNRRRVWRLHLSTNIGKIIVAATILELPLTKSLSYFYCPKGPVFARGVNLEKAWQLLLDKLSDLAIHKPPVFFRVDPGISGPDSEALLSLLSFKKLPWEVQPKRTVVLDLCKTEAQLLHAAKPKTRYNIHLAQKKGVQVSEYHNGQKAKIFWDLLTQTAARDRFSPHPYLYYFNLLEVLGKAGLASLFIASFQGRPLAAGIMSVFAGRATYLHGASSNWLRSAMAPYLVQWSAISAAKGFGAKVYDFGGVAPEGEGGSHPWSGISRFKRGFGGQEIEYIGAYDLVYDKWWYAAYRLARKVRRLGNF